MSNFENAKKFDENLLKYWGLSGAKACKSCRSCLLYTSDAADDSLRVDLVKSFPTNIYLQNLASIQPRTSLLKFDLIFTYLPRPEI